MIPKRKHVQEDNADSWLMSYADMITLLMCFFVIFVSVSEPKKNKLTELANGINGKFGSVDYTNPFLGTMRSLQTTIEAKQLLKDVAVKNDDSAIYMELASARFFKLGSTELDGEQLPALTELITNLQNTGLDFTIQIEAHTSDVPPPGGIYPTNWDLSSAQAARMVRLFVDQGFAPKKLKAVGAGDAQPKVPNRDAKNEPIPENEAQNQRIIIVLKRE